MRETQFAGVTAKHKKGKKEIKMDTCMLDIMLFKERENRLESKNLPKSKINVWFIANRVFVDCLS